jgi:hypothetical protein
VRVNRLSSYAFVVLILCAFGFAQCGGTERWGVKDGTDPSASKVDLSNIRLVSIEELIGIQEPHLPARNDNETRLPQETQVYKVQARLVKWKEEAGDSGDNDYHLVLTDDTLKFTQSRGAPTGRSRLLIRRSWRLWQFIAILAQQPEFAPEHKRRSQRN